MNTTMKRHYVYIVTYVSISEEDAANGYSYVETYDDYLKAVEKLKLVREAEIENLDSNCTDYEIMTDKPDEFRVAWNNKAEQVFVEVKRDYIH